MLSVERAFAGANERLAAPLRLRFELARRAAWRPAGASLDDYLERLREQVGPRPGGIVVGLTGLRPRPDGVFGATSYVDALTVLSVRPGGPAWDRELAHELAHVFGAIHVGEHDELMARDGRGLRLDAVNAQLLELHSARAFPPSAVPLDRPGLETAARLYQEAARSAPAGAYRALVVIETARGDGRAALRAADALVAVRPEPRSLSLRARVAADLARLEAPVDAHGVACRKTPRNTPHPAQALQELAASAARAGRLEEAARIYRRALQLRPESAPVLVSLARVLQETGRPEEALNCARRAAELAPQDPAIQAGVEIVRAQAHPPRTARLDPSSAP